MYCDSFAYPQKHHFDVKPAVNTFWATLEIIRATVYLNIWSH